MRLAGWGGTLCAWLLASVASVAQPAPACPPTARAPTNDEMRAGLRDARDHGFLWRISQGGRSSFLFGTLHVARPEWMYPGPQLARALQATDTLALELDMLDPDIQRRLAEGMAPRPDDAALAPELQQRIDRLAQAQCLPPQALAALGPELQIATLMSLAGRHDGLDPSYGIDIFLSGWGHGQNKTVVSLETPELQVKMLRADTPAERDEFVRNSLESLESDQARPMVRRLSQVWADGDLGQLDSYERWCDCVKTDADRSAMTRMLDDRNPALADRIAALHASGKAVFAAVGSLHMIGPTGLPALLARRGFRVERVERGPRSEPRR